jgi:hypothetical protein
MCGDWHEISDRSLQLMCKLGLLLKGLNLLEHVYSKFNNGQLLHLVFRLGEMAGRKNLVNNSEFLQVAALEIGVGEFFNAHKHIKKSVNFPETIAQESWVVISGRILVTFYDLDDSILETKVLCPGDCSITLQGGHKYEAIENSVVYEFKSGPYEGQLRDKLMID